MYELLHLCDPFDCCHYLGIGLVCRGECVEVLGNLPWKVASVGSSECSAAYRQSSSDSNCRQSLTALFFVIAGADPQQPSTNPYPNPNPSYGYGYGSSSTFSILHPAHFDSLPVPLYVSSKYECFEEQLVV